MTIDSTVGNNPRLNPEAIWVGVDIDLPVSAAICDSAEEMVAHFCENYLDLNINNIVWATVNKSVDNGIEYAVSYEENDEHWVNTGGGFIYTTVDKVMKDYAVCTIDACILAEIFMKFETQVAAYTDWIHGKVTTPKTATKRMLTSQRSEPINLTMTDKERFLEGNKYTVMKPEMAEVIFEMCGGWEQFKMVAPDADDRGIIKLDAVNDIDTAVAVYQKHQKLIMEWLIDEAANLEYDDAIELVNGDRDSRDIPNVKPPKYSDAEVAAALFCYNTEAHKYVAQHVVRLAMQLLSHDYGSFVRHP